MHIETITPAYAVGDRVIVLDSQMHGTVAKLYPASGVALYYGTRRLIHTHCYELTTAYGPMWGLVDALLVAEPVDIPNEEPPITEGDPVPPPELRSAL